MSTGKQSDVNDRTTQGNADRRHEVVRATHARQQSVAKPSSGKRGNKAIHDNDRAENFICRFQRIPTHAREKRWHPYLDAAKGKGHGGHAQRDRPKRRVAASPKSVPRSAGSLSESNRPRSGSAKD